MSYMEDFEKALRHRIGSLAVEVKDGKPYIFESQLEELIKWLKDRIYESYKNGLEAGKKGGKQWKKGHDSPSH
jgi:hypothetical protein